jgi:hypothetical protein
LTQYRVRVDASSIDLHSNVVRFVISSRSFVVCALIACAGPLHAQSGSRVTEPPSTPASRWQADRDQLDLALRARALTATDPRGLWIAGQLDAGDPVAQSGAFAQARTQAPTEKIFLASLAVSCLAPVQPLPPPCDATDRLADWATRDVDNGVPALLLADRARQRSNVTVMAEYLEEVAQRPRFDDYASRGALLYWEAVRALPGTIEPAARAELAASYGALRESYVAQQMQFFCRDTKLADAIRAACNKAGNAVAQRGATWALRLAGARLAERSAADGPAQTAAQQQLADVTRRAFECAETGDPLAIAFESPDAAVRARAVVQWEARLTTDAQIGEAAACALPAKG